MLDIIVQFPKFGLVWPDKVNHAILISRKVSCRLWKHGNVLVVTLGCEGDTG